MIARIRLREDREPYTKKLRRCWIAEHYDADGKEWKFICAEDSCMKARMYMEDWCRFRKLEVPRIVDIVR